MVKTPRQHRDEFDAGREFVVTRPRRISGTNFTPGQPFDKRLVTVRRLRQLYEQRCLAMRPGMGSGTPLTPSKPDFASLPEEMLVDWLKVHGVVTRVGASFQFLLRMANNEWERRFGANPPPPVTNGNGAEPEVALAGLSWPEQCKRVKEQTGIWPKNKQHLSELLAQT